MRGRRLLADVVDLVLVLPFAVPLSWVFFAMFGFAFLFVGDALEAMMSRPTRLLFLSWGCAWAMAFVLARAGNGPTTGERVAGLTPPAGPQSRIKSWMRALFLADLPLGWVLPARPVERALGIARVRDHTQTVLEAVGNAYRKRPGVLVVLGLVVLIPIGAIPAWARTLEGQHRRLLAQTVAEYGDFCGHLLTSEKGRDRVRMVAEARTLAPESFAFQLPPGSHERKSLDAAMATLDGPCASVEIGDRVPMGATAAPRTFGHPLVAFKTLPGVPALCGRLWSDGSHATPDLPWDPQCGQRLLLGDSHAAPLADGRRVGCWVFEREGKVVAVLTDCGR